MRPRNWLRLVRVVFTWCSLSERGGSRAKLRRYRCLYLLCSVRKWKWKRVLLEFNVTDRAFVLVVVISQSVFQIRYESCRLIAWKSCHFSSGIHCYSSSRIKCLRFFAPSVANKDLAITRNMKRCVDLKSNKAHILVRSR